MVLMYMDVCRDSDESKLEVDVDHNAKLEDVDGESVVKAVRVVELQIGTLVMFKPVQEVTEIEVVAEKHNSIIVDD